MNYLRIIDYYKQNKLELIEFQINYQVIISGGVFENNSAHNGGSLFIQEINILIQNSLFYNNSAKIGGAIYYFSEQTQLDFFRSQYLNNTAQIAGAVYFKNHPFNQLMNLKSNFQTTIQLSLANSLSIAIDGDKIILNKELLKKTSDEIIEQTTVAPHKILGYTSLVNYLKLPSGRSISSYRYFDQYTNSVIPYNLTFRIIALDKFNKQNKGLYNSSCTLKPKTFNLTSQQEVKEFPFSLFKYHVLFDNSTGDFNLDDLIIYWNPNYGLDLVLRISIQCHHLSVPLYLKEPPYLIQGYNTNYKLLVDIRLGSFQLKQQEDAYCAINSKTNINSQEMPQIVVLRMI